jgi:hypothetical protein
MTGRWTAYTTCGALGVAAATAVAAIVLHGRDEPSGAVLVVLAAGLAASAAVAGVTAAVLRGPTLIALHHLAAVTGVAVPVALVVDVPVPLLLDAVVTGLVALLALGRVGCLLVGCCHGTPSRRGVRYGPRHVAAGFPAHLSGVPLAPVQAAESALACAALALGLAVALGGGEPGTAAADVAVAYCAGRSLLEFRRGDAPRARWAGLTHAQWTTWATAAVVAGAAPVAWRLVAVAGSGAFLLAAVARHRRGGPSAALGTVRHVHELARALRAAGTTGGTPQIVLTTAGLAVSGGVTEADGRRWSHCTLSFPAGTSPRVVSATARLVHVLRDGRARCTVLARGPHRVQVVLEHPRPMR